jgi:ribosome biogenesis GTPase
MDINADKHQPAALEDLGWDSFFEGHFAALAIPNTIPARVSAESRELFQVYSQYGELDASVSGRMRYLIGEVGLYPAVGDWVAVQPVPGERKAVIQAVLPRKSRFSRQIAGERSDEQIVSANIDSVFIVSGLDGGRSFNLRRIERYLTLAWNSGATPVIVLNKVDLCDSIEDYISSVENIAPGINVHPVSTKHRTGIEALGSYLTRGSTAAFLGSSGVGKSALINALLGTERQPTGEVRADDRMGRHTTTWRELILLPGGGVVIDTPGMREIQLWGDEGDLLGAFQDIETLAEQCRFTDCSHNSETGCAVRQAVEQGELDPARLDSYHKLQKELQYLASREDNSTRQYEKQRWKKVAKWAKELKKRPR